MAKIQPVRDLENNLIAPVTHERAVYDSEGYTIEQKLSEVKPSGLYGPGTYDAKTVDLENIVRHQLSLGTTNYTTEGQHIRVFVRPGDIVKVVTNVDNWTYSHFLSNAKQHVSGQAISSIEFHQLAPRKTYYFTAPENSVAFAVNALSSDGETVMMPESITVLSPKARTADERISSPQEITGVSCQRYRVSGSYDTIVAETNTNAVAFAFPVKAGKEYLCIATSTGQISHGFIPDLPNATMEVTSKTTIAAIAGVDGVRFVVKPETDCFFFISSYDTSGAALTVSLKENIDYSINGNVVKLDDMTQRLLLSSASYDEVDLDEYDIFPYSIQAATGHYGTSEDSKHVLVPVTPGQIIKVVPGASNAGIAWLTSDAAPVRQGVPDFVPGTALVRLMIQSIVTVPDGAAYMYVNFGQSSGGYIYRPAYIGVFNGKVSGGGGGPVGTDILALNPDSEFIPKMTSAKKRYYTSGTTDSPYPLVIAHISDIHGNWENVRRFLSFTNRHKSRIDVMVNTGDTVPSWLTQNGSRYADIDTYNEIEGVENILNVIGNHDTADRSNPEGSYVWKWQENVGVAAYNVYIKPHVSSWNVTQPEGAEANGLCYYYKDFTANNVRLVVTDVMGYDETEDAWLASVLEGARDAGLHVVIATHFSSSLPAAEGYDRAFDKFAINYSTTYEVGTNAVNLNAYNKKAYKMMETVDAFMQAGGIFVGYIQGHYHCDFIARVAKYPNQLIFSIGSSKTGEVRDYMHTIGQRDQDEFQIVAIDTYTKNVKVYKVGANVDRVGRHINSACVSYETHQVIAEGY